MSPLGMAARFQDLSQQIKGDEGTYIASWLHGTVGLDPIHLSESGPVAKPIKVNGESLILIGGLWFSSRVLIRKGNMVHYYSGHCKSILQQMAGVTCDPKG